MKSVRPTHMSCFTLKHTYTHTHADTLADRHRSVRSAIILTRYGEDISSVPSCCISHQRDFLIEILLRRPDDSPILFFCRQTMGVVCFFSYWQVHDRLLHDSHSRYCRCYWYLRSSSYDGQCQCGSVKNQLLGITVGVNIHSFCRSRMVIRRSTTYSVWVKYS